MNFILFDDSTTRTNLQPLTFTRPIAELRVGITTIREKWESALQTSTSTLTEEYLSVKFPLKREEHNVLIDGSIIPNPDLAKQIKALKANQALVHNETMIAYYNSESDTAPEDMEQIEYSGEVLKVNFLWDLYVLNDAVLRSDFEQLTAGRKSAPLSDSNQLIGKGGLFIEEGAVIEGAILNTNTGPIYIGKDAEIMEGSCIRGPFALCDHAAVKLGTKIYGATTIGPYSKVGGELNNVIFTAYSNKAHDGFLGNSVIGEWCNMGAGTTSSNLKNTYDEVKIWNYTWDTFIATGQQFCGLFMGDHSKTAIQTTLNTGTVIGVGTNAFGSGFLRNFIPSFTWGGKQYDFNKFVDTAKRVYARRDREFDANEESIMKHVFNTTAKNRR